MSPIGRKRVRNLIPKVALVFVSTAISLVLVEIGLRTAGYEPRRVQVNVGFDSWAAPDPEMGWVNSPGTWQSSEAGHVPMSFERDGRRADPAGNKPAKLPKILVVGCSFTQGYGVTDDQTFSHLINEALPSAELLNFGTGAYGSYQSRLRVKHYFSSPHLETPLVIYGLFYSHHLRDLAPVPWIVSLTMKDGRYMVPPNIRTRHDAIVESPGGPIDLWPLERQTATVALIHHGVLRVAHRVTPAMAEPVFRHGITEMKKAAVENNAALLIIGLTELPAADLAWLQGQRGEKQIDFVACEHPDFGKDSDLQVGGVGHPNLRLHRWWADCALKALAARGY